MSAGNALAVVRAPAAAVTGYDAEAHSRYLEAKREIIKRMCIPEEFQKDETLFETFLEIAALRGLNPLMKQLYCIPRNKRPSIEISIDGLRLIAARSGCYAGIDAPTWEQAPPLPDGTVLPFTATATVYRATQGQVFPYTATVFWDEFGKASYNATYQNNWKTMPYHMLAKVAQSHALRMAFPEETSGLYTSDEMEQASYPAAAAREIRTAPPPQPIARPRTGGSSRAQLRETVAKAATTAIKATIAPTPAGEEGIAVDRTARSHAMPSSPDEDDTVLRDELRELGRRGFDLNKFLTRRNKELTDLTRGELEGILPAAREVVQQRVERLSQQA
jgi:phage recombination protein Bet